MWSEMADSKATACACSTARKSQELGLCRLSICNGADPHSCPDPLSRGGRGGT